MLQRIQTLFLLASALLLCSLFLQTIEGTSLIFTIITTAISLVSIFLYRRRQLQIKLSILNIIILMAYQAVILYCIFSVPEKPVFTLHSLIPAVAALFTFLAKIYISRDEELVKSTSRLRK